MKRLLGILIVLIALGCRSKNDNTTASTSVKKPTAPAVKEEDTTPAKQKLGKPITNSIGMVLVPIPPGEFMMGGPYGPYSQYHVKITRPFHLGSCEVTQSQYEKVMGTNPSQFKGANNPVEFVDYDDAVEFCRKLSALPREKAAGRLYRLPTEAEWEYACRAGTTTDYCFGNDSTKIGEYCWYFWNSGGKPHPVGQKKPNSWALCDMQGNVSEWCQDWLGYKLNQDWSGKELKGPATDPTGPAWGSVRVIRGGRWSSFAAGDDEWVQLRRILRDLRAVHVRNWI